MLVVAPIVIVMSVIVSSLHSQSQRGCRSAARLVEGCTQKMDRGTILRVWLPLVGGLWSLGWVFQSPPGPHGLARSIGLLLGLIGLAGVIFSRYTLGRSFSVAPKATALVTRGIYSRIRNPIYVSGMIFLVGLVLIVGRPELLTVLLVLIPVQIIRARREAAVLEAKFGDAYREYRKRTWF
jgi:protein-S-isoprenylcysteine O-methyltransferase Ste14